jgi:hypothetical protein
MVTNYVKLHWSGDLVLHSSYQDYLAGRATTKSRPIVAGQVVTVESVQIIKTHCNLHFSDGTVAMEIPKGLYEVMVTRYEDPLLGSDQR